MDEHARVFSGMHFSIALTELLAAAFRCYVFMPGRVSEGGGETLTPKMEWLCRFFLSGLDKKKEKGAGGNEKILQSFFLTHAGSILTFLLPPS